MFWFVNQSLTDKERASPAGRGGANGRMTQYFFTLLLFLLHYLIFNGMFMAVGVSV